MGSANAFDVTDKVPCCIALDACVWARSPAAALIKEDNAIMVGVKIAPHRRAAPTAGAAMKDNDRLTVWIAGLFHIKRMTIAHIKHPAIERIDCRVKKMRCALLARVFVHNSPI